MSIDDSLPAAALPIVAFLEREFPNGRADTGLEPQDWLTPIAFRSTAYTLGGSGLAAHTSESAIDKAREERRASIAAAFLAGLLGAAGAAPLYLAWGSPDRPGATMRAMRATLWTARYRLDLAGSSVRFGRRGSYSYWYELHVAAVASLAPPVKRPKLVTALGDLIEARETAGRWPKNFGGAGPTQTSVAEQLEAELRSQGYDPKPDTVRRTIGEKGWWSGVGRKRRE